jgi:hypothetical protein
MGGQHSTLFARRSFRTVVEFSGFRGDGDPRETLIRFVRALHDFLDEIVETNYDPLGRPLFWEQLLEPMHSAWREVNVNGHFTQVENGIRALTEDQ